MGPQIVTVIGQLLANSVDYFFGSDVGLEVYLQVGIGNKMTLLIFEAGDGGELTLFLIIGVMMFGFGADTDFPV